MILMLEKSVVKHEFLSIKLRFFSMKLQFLSLKNVCETRI